MEINRVMLPTPTRAKDLKPGDEVLLWGLAWKVRSVEHPFVEGRAQIYLELGEDVMMIACASSLLVDKI